MRGSGSAEDHRPGWLGRQVDRAKSHTKGIDHHPTRPVDWKLLAGLLVE